MNSDGSNNHRLTNNYIDSFPAWSPDGTKIIFQRNVEDEWSENSEGIFLINIDGTGLQKVLSKGSLLPIWR
jgi:Tol biopolymer transport system component